MNDAEIFSRAADLLEKQGWIQREFHDSEGRHCAYGAIMQVTNAKHAYVGVALTRTWYAKLIEKLYPDAEGLIEPTVSGWNDKEGQTAENVIATLRELANE